MVFTSIMLLSLQRGSMSSRRKPTANPKAETLRFVMTGGSWLSMGSHPAGTRGHSGECEGGGNMTFQATVYRILIASPSDLIAERKAIPEILSSWNAIYSDRMKVILLPVMWETH